ncbi:TnsA endonuclease N-terminal domain-containing protein [Paraburkholderia adhaesiva]|uniref:TnsA endonuclease N-terminal domain-containing protein n=1 Tax=Paraburkholderia adhaesiva TaxID=2883244 RepID=UPI001F27E822|nr:TnsA endonuclease N-terminal domain-containing protein [Paraburkholderia adhaesiva]
MPVRKIPKNYRNVTGVAAHRKAEGAASFESTLERDFIALLEFDPAVERFEVQPITLDWSDDQGRARSYTPDAIATFKLHGQPRRTVLYEVKYRSDLHANWPDLRQKFKASIRYARQQGWRFKIVTEVEIRTPYLDNATFLLPFMRRGPSEEAHMALLTDRLAEMMHRTTPADLLAACYQDEWHRAALIPTLWYLVGTRQIGTDLDEKLTMASPIWSLPV